MNVFFKIFISLLLLFFGAQPLSATWVKQKSGTLAWLKSIYFINEKSGWIAGSNGTLLSTTDGGQSWIQEKKFTEDTIREVYFTNSEQGWLLCERNIYATRGKSPSYLLKTSDAGESWEKIEFNDNSDRITDIFFTAGGSGFAVGESGAIWSRRGEKDVWTKGELPVRYLMLAGHFNDDRRGILAGGGGTILFTEDGGSTWFPATISDQNKKKINSLFFIDRKSGWAAGLAGKIYFTDSGGKNWLRQDSGTTENLSDIFFINRNEGVVVGDNGTILRTVDGGKVWTLEKNDVRHKLEKVFFFGSKGFAVGFGGTILAYAASSKE